MPAFVTEQVRPDELSGNVSGRSAKTTSRRKDWILWAEALLIFCAIMAATLLFLLVRKTGAANEFRQLAEQVRQAEEREAAENPITEYIASAESAENSSGETESVRTEPAVETILPKYAQIYQMNQDLFGWIRMEGTELDYPVMRSEADNEKYLYADFDGDYSYAGTPFADNQCTRHSDNILIYGHNIRDGSMFRSLLKYERESYWKEHPTILFSDLYGDYEYEVLAVFYDRVYARSETAFKFYQFTDAESEADFNYAISQFKEKSIYDTGVEAQYGDKLITLSTCAYHVKNGRFAVVARRK